ncbi:hypothetical protein HNY73_007644 [Argiope bruennichi]|uniref:Uncharacterized protein n=1 Tax=Argiope bruennichi TaxID=94029 RepID=A0A8T0FH60_ARGBR|nr:hypothetical protein HNY73_007644 [Argiope bruennichi]
MVPSGYVHVYRTTAAPMLFYLLDPNNDHVRKFPSGRQVVPEKRSVSTPFHVCRARKTTYAVLMVQKTLFFLHVVQADGLNDTFYYLKPNAGRRLLKNIDDDAQRDGNGNILWTSPIAKCNNKEWT